MKCDTCGYSGYTTEYVWLTLVNREGKLCVSCRETIPCIILPQKEGFGV